jgi:gluconate 2-dehydrogenase gamma chain
MWSLPEQTTGFLSPEQKAQVAVLFNALQPGDAVRHIPNAEQAGAVNYIDLLLARSEDVFADIGKWKALYPLALDELNKNTILQFSKNLELLNNEEASKLIQQLETNSVPNLSVSVKQAELFDTLRRHCIQGCFCDPRWGGNTNNLMWKWYGYQEETKESRM